MATASDAAVERGRAIAQDKCARCHAIGREGNSPIALAPPFRDIAKRYPVGHLAEALAEGIVTGHPIMPELIFEPADINALLGFIESLSSSKKR